MHNFWTSVVAAGIQANEQAPLVTHPALLVVQVDMIALHSLSVVNVTGSYEQFNWIDSGSEGNLNGIHLSKDASHSHFIVENSCNCILFHSDSVNNPFQVDGFVFTIIS